MISSFISRLAGFIANQIASLLGSDWKWVGDDAYPWLFVKNTRHQEFEVKVHAGIDEETGRNDRFIDVWRPGALPIPSNWRSQLGEDIQWYAPPQEHRFALLSGDRKVTAKTASELKAQLTRDAMVVVGERVLYQAQVEVFFRGELVALKNRLGLEISLDSGMAEADEIVDQMIREAVNEARQTWFYKSVVFSAA